MYGNRDISTTENGDLVVDNGDLAISTASESLLRTVNFCLLTNYSGYKPERHFGASPDKFIGQQNNSNTRNEIRLHIDYYLKNQGLLMGATHSLNVVPVGNHEIAVILKINTLIIESSTEASPQEMIIAYKYDFNNGTLEAVA
jgi:hypothetical protein